MEISCWDVQYQCHSSSQGKGEFIKCHSFHFQNWNQPDFIFPLQGTKVSDKCPCLITNIIKLTFGTCSVCVKMIFRRVACKNKPLHFDFYSCYITFQESLDPNQIFNLSRFACTAVNISFAAVNCNGMSAYSPPTEVCIHGGEYIAVVTDYWFTLITVLNNSAIPSSVPTVHALHMCICSCSTHSTQLYTIATPLHAMEVPYSTVAHSCIQLLHHCM